VPCAYHAALQIKLSAKHKLLLGKPLLGASAEKIARAFTVSGPAAGSASKQVLVVDEKGRLIPGAKVQVKMTRHAFRWGTSLVPSSNLLPRTPRCLSCGR